MSPMLRAAAVSSFVIALGAVGLFAYPSLATDVGGLWHVMDDQERIRAVEQSDARIDRETELAQRRIALKQEVIRDLLDGRMTFDEATQRFADVNRMQACALELTRKRYPGKTDEERAAWQLVNYLQRTPEPAARAIAAEWEMRLRDRS